MTKLAFLSEPWCAAIGELLPPGGGSAPGRVGQVVITGAATGDVRLVVSRDEGGVVTVSRAEVAPPPDLVVTVSRSDAAALVAGDLDLSAAYMQGRAKLAGDHALVLRSLAATAEPEWEDLRAQVASVTDFGDGS